MNLAIWLARVAQVSPHTPALFHGTEQVADYASRKGITPLEAENLLRPNLDR